MSSLYFGQKNVQQQCFIQTWPQQNNLAVYVDRLDRNRSHQCTKQVMSVPLNFRVNTVHRDAFCHFAFQWIYYCHSSKSTGKKTDKTHICAVLYQCITTVFTTKFNETDVICKSMHPAQVCSNLGTYPIFGYCIYSSSIRVQTSS